MQDPRNPLVKVPMLFVSVSCVVLALLFTSCGVTLPVQREAWEAGGEAAPTYSIVCIIHGDGNYRYHDTGGNEYNADEETLAGAIRVAQRNPHAEMFIFHHKPRRNLLFFFPLHDGEFYYYRNGRLVAHEVYWRNREHPHFDPEVDLYHRFRADNRDGMVNMFLYYGHEIPEFDGDVSDRTFTVHDVATGLRGFTGSAGGFDLMVLSTCFGGTPYTIGSLGRFTRYIVASPGNLHLSYLDLSFLERLDHGLQDGNVPAFARAFASRAFDRLAGDVQTAVSVAVYDVDGVQDYLHSVFSVYDHTLTTLKGSAQASTTTPGRCDCGELPAYEHTTMGKGVEVFYRPALFGRSKHKQSHSGWECWREGWYQAATSTN